MEEKTWKEKQAEVVEANKGSRQEVEIIAPPRKANPLPKLKETRALYKGTNRHSKKKR